MQSSLTMAGTALGPLILGLGVAMGGNVILTPLLVLYSRIAKEILAHGNELTAYGQARPRLLWRVQPSPAPTRGAARGAERVGLLLPQAPSASTRPGQVRLGRVHLRATVSSVVQCNALFMFDNISNVTGVSQQRVLAICCCRRCPRPPRSRTPLHCSSV